MQPIRISVGRLARVLLTSLALPLLSGLLLDLLLDTSPVAALIAGLVCIPLAAFFVSRAVLSELDRVIQVVASQETSEQLSE